MPPQHEWIEKDFYKVLGVSSDASEKEITKAYRKLAREFHPDKNPGDVKAEERFKEISAAYDVINDPKKRAEYDELRRLGPAAGGFGRGFGGTQGAPGGGGFDVGDLGDLLGGLFGNRTRPSGGGAAAGPVRGGDLEAELHLSFDDALAGITTSVHLTSEAPCSTCRGSGAKPGTVPSTCGQCGGRGVLDDNQGLFSFSQPCPSCGGRGRVIKDPCPSCYGSGMERRPRQVKVRIPAGVKDGQRIKLKGRGTPGRNGGPAGDLFVLVKVAEHEIFGRRGDHLTITVPITYTEAALGAKVAVPTLDGGAVTLKLPAGTPTGKTFRVKGKGAATSKGVGDLLVTVEVAVPTKLSDRQREALEALDRVLVESPRSRIETLARRARTTAASDTDTGDGSFESTPGGA
ncbi:MAG: molecular chaperone DnaJ [Acidimicrobiales bacterium]